MRRIGKVILGLLVVLIVMVLAGVGVMMGDALLFQQAADVTNVEYPAADGTTLRGYLIQPEGDGPFPAVLMVHEWWGLNGEITEMAQILAEEGYVVLAPDTYRGSVATTVPGALYLRLNVSEARVNADMQAAYAYLTGLPKVDIARVGVMGFCYGGGVAMRYALENPALAGIINLYGDTVDDTAGFGALLENGRPVLGIFGERDNQIPLTEVEAFRAALEAAEIPHEVTVYPDVGHAFVQPSALDEPGAPRDAWEQIITFLNANVRDRVAS